KSKGAKSALRRDLLDTILNDKKNLVNDIFNIEPYFKASTHFWFSIYTQYTSQQVVIHDKENLDLVYNVMDFEPLHQSSINRFAKSKLQADLALEHANRVKKALSGLHQAPGNLSSEEKAVLSSIKKSSVKIPANSEKKAALFKKLASRLRTQTGQRDMVFNGVLRSLPYQHFLDEQFDNFNLPRELLAVAFVESSFNLKAQSYAGASGVWQFMPRTAASFMPERNKHIDYRANPVISSLAALHLLKQNKLILKRWDLAVPAYNFGTSHLVKARRTLKGEVTLAKVLENYSHDNVGFASKNYYSEFLAMAYALAYKDLIYPLSGYQKKNQKFKKDNIGVYVTKCRLRPKTFFNLLKNSSHGIKELNAHFRRWSPTFGRNKIVVSDVNLTHRKYRRISNKELLKHYPKYLYKLARDSSCNSGR
ncbi:MAG: transglycosylase SLT domain-containing protein, partial [Bacteriovoracaceae bacterium]